MNPTERRHERIVTWAVVASFAAFWLIVVATSEPPEFNDQYVQYAVAWVLFTTPWAFAARYLWRAWWARTGVSLSELDGPARLLAAAVAALPDERRDWGAAMAAELDQVRGSSARWWFALGCARTAIFPPRSSRVPVLLVAAQTVAAVVAAGPIVGYALPAMRVFAMTFVALVGAMATLAVARSRRVRQTAPGPTIATAGVAGVAACTAVTAYFLVKNPAAAEHLSPSAAVIFAVVLAGCLWLALTPPRGLTSSRLARVVGICTALVFGIGFLVSSRLTIHTHGGPLGWVLLAPPPIFFIFSAVAARYGRSFGAGAQTAIWTALVATLLVFAISMPETMHRYAIDGRTLGDGESGYPIGVNLPGAIWVLVVIPIWGLPFGVIGAAIGNASWQRRRQPRGD